MISERGVMRGAGRRGVWGVGSRGAVPGVAWSGRACRTVPGVDARRTAGQVASSRRGRKDKRPFVRLWRGQKEEEAVANGSCDGGSGRQRQQLLLLTAAPVSITETAEVDQGQTNCNSDRDKQQQGQCHQLCQARSLWPRSANSAAATVALQAWPAQQLCCLFVVVCVCVCV